MASEEVMQFTVTAIYQSTAKSIESVDQNESCLIIR